MESKRNQQGMTMISWVMIFVVAGFFALLLMKLGPVYLENYTIKKIVASLENEPAMNRSTIRDIRNLIYKRLNINNIRSLGKDNIKITILGGKTHVEIAYEDRRNIVGNVDAIISFKETIDLNSN